MMATVPHITSGLGLRKFQADGFLLTRVYLTENTVFSNQNDKSVYVVYRNTCRLLCVQHVLATATAGGTYSYHKVLKG